MRIHSLDDRETRERLDTLGDRVFRLLENLPDGTRALVERALTAIPEDGDPAIAALQSEISGRAARPDAIRIPAETIAAAKGDGESTEDDALAPLRDAIVQMTRFHENARPVPTATYRFLGSRIVPVQSPVRRVGVLVPGGGSPAISALLGAVLPAKAAGVSEIAIAVTPDASGEVKREVLAVAAELGIDEIHALSPLPAFVAFAFGSDTIARADLVAGHADLPTLEASRRIGQHVTATRLVGHSELVVLADDSARPDWLAADILANAERSELSATIVLTENAQLAEAVVKAVDAQLEPLETRDVARRSLDDHGCVIVTPDVDAALTVIDELAPQSVEIVRADAADVVPRIENAASVLVGPYSPASLGALCAGPSRLLPAGGSARFASGLSVRDFCRETVRIELTEEGCRDLTDAAKALADAEGLDGHHRSLEARRS